MNWKNSIYSRALAATLAIGTTACLEHEKNKDQFLEGKVLEESGTVLQILDPDKKEFLPEIVAKNPSYLIKVETVKGNYIIDLASHYERPSKRLSTMAVLIEPGMYVKFQTHRSDGVPYFSSDRVGMLSTRQIEVLDNKK
jgi:hypothetical protein